MNHPSPVLERNDDADAALEASALPAFDSNGNLPPGDYWPSRAAFEVVFVAITGSTTRGPIYERFSRYRTELQARGVPVGAVCLLNGSFTTSKIDPGDIDIAVEVDADRFLGCEHLQSLLGGPTAKKDWSCDAYPVLVYPDGHPDHERVTKGAREYWIKWFGTDRQSNPKGRVWSSLGGFR
jgi:uncharacterized protein DUF6932